MRFEVETMKQAFISDAEGDIAEQKAQRVKAKEINLLQQEEFSRKDAELEAERIHRKFEERLREERERQDTMH
jgi:hypothetical protein